mgnify:FL=1
MARGRMLDRVLSTSAKRARLHDIAGPLAEFAQALYPLLIAHADDFGRESGDTFTVKHTIDPTSPRTLDEFDRALDALVSVGLIRRYVVKDRAVIEITDFDDHQTGLHKRTSSKYPPLPSDLAEVPGTSGEYRPNRTELKGTEPNGRERNRNRNRNRNGTERKAKNAAAPRVAAQNVRVIAGLVVRELLPKGIADEGELIEETKKRAARLHIAYNAGAISRAVSSAIAQAAKGR